MVALPSRPNRIHVGILAALTLAGATTLRGPLAGGGKFADLTIGVLVTFGCVVAYGNFRIGVSRARRSRGFREWSGPLSSHRLMQILMLTALVFGAWHIYDACLKIFTKVFE